MHCFGVYVFWKYYPYNIVHCRMLIK